MRQEHGLIRETVHALDKIMSSTLVLILKSKHKAGCQCLYWKYAENFRLDFADRTYQSEIP